MSKALCHSVSDAEGIFKFKSIPCVNEDVTLGVFEEDDRVYWFRPRGSQYLARWALPRLYDIDALSRIVEPSLKGAYSSKSLSNCLYNHVMYSDVINIYG
ncbi:uncharacterized protein [Primulina eburnea]|uniref:uncharacterized protein isoform X2 n=1 Tax=Primulina eburnea TaxID=1245227 RepID=UPI003C6C6264